MLNDTLRTQIPEYRLACDRKVVRQSLESRRGTHLSGFAARTSIRRTRMEGFVMKTSKLVGLAGAALALSLLAGCSSNQPDPAQRAVNAANRADQAASRADAAAQKASQAAA